MDNPRRETNVKSKLLPLKEAVAAYVIPGMKLHIAGGIGGASAAICEIIRRFYGTKPDFTLIQSTVTGHAINLLSCNLVRKMIFSACVDISTSGRPSRIMQQKWADKSVDFENWSLCSLQQRLMAGALGTGFLPTRSVAGSRMAADNKNAFREIDNPFDGSGKIGIVKALNPDISVVHGCAADEQGNTIMAIPYGDDIWGALASAGGVVVTVEKIVPTDIIRKHAALVKIPGHMVKAVCVAPLGVHPFSLANPGLDDFAGYESDVEFLQELHRAFASPEKLDAWLKEWVLRCPTQEDYLKKLGERRVEKLREVKPPDKSSEVPASTATANTEYADEEMMLVAAAREIVKIVVKSGLKTVLLGAGSRSAAVLVAYHQLKKTGHEFDVITGNGQYGYDPLPGELGLQCLAGIYSSKMVMDTMTSQGIIIGGKNNRCLGVLGAGQIDKYGNTNSTLTSDGQFLVGSGGANDVGNAREVIVILNQSKDRFVAELPYVTCPGDRVTTVVSGLGIFKKPAGKEELRLAACLPDPKITGIRERIERIRENCSWKLEASDAVEDVPAPTAEELSLLRRLT
jgi:acyl CoA:acetate/3-ketoacid CoA transferase alpha subunit/acyl CoA:acetate/3-ketoacid CoA transferase beta subunit